jgi:hypothetical protein
MPILGADDFISLCQDRLKSFEAGIRYATSLIFSIAAVDMAFVSSRFAACIWLSLTQYREKSILAAKVFILKSSLISCAS